MNGFYNLGYALSLHPNGVVIPLQMNGFYNEPPVELEWDNIVVIPLQMNGFYNPSKDCLIGYKKKLSYRSK